MGKQVAGFHDRLRRIHWLYERLKRKGFPSRRDFLDTFEVSPSTFKRDLAFLRDRLGAPIKYSSGRQGYFLTDNDFELPSFWFNRSHLLILAGICRQFELLALSLVNRLQITGNDFTTTETGAVVMDNKTRKELLVAYQKRKQEEVLHPFINEKIALGLLPFAQAQIFCRYLCGDL